MAVSMTSSVSQLMGQDTFMLRNLADKDSFGLSARRPIGKGTLLGPFHAPLTRTPLVSGSNLLLQAAEGALFYDTTQSECCNWLAFVRPTALSDLRRLRGIVLRGDARAYYSQCRKLSPRAALRANLLVVVHDRQLFFQAARNIVARRELRVWFSDQYLDFVGAAKFDVFGTPMCAISLDITSTNQLRPDANVSLDWSPTDGPVHVTDMGIGVHAGVLLSELPGNGVGEMPTGAHNANVPPKMRAKALHRQAERVEVPGILTATSLNVTDQLAVSATNLMPTNIEQATVDTSQLPALECDQRHVDGNLGVGGTMATDLHFCCQFCDAAFATAALLKRHQRLHKEKAVYRCPFCELRFTDASNMRRHAKQHSSQPKPHACSACGLRFSRPDVLHHHWLAHHAYEQQVYVCNTCQKQFRTKFNAQKHLALHQAFALVSSASNNASESNGGASSSSRQHAVCPLCQLSCESPSALVRHIRQHKGRLAVATTQLSTCSQCAAVFRHKHDLRRHQRAKHLHVPATPDAPANASPLPTPIAAAPAATYHAQLVCRFCSKQFNRKDNLIRHERTLHKDAKMAPAVCSAHSSSATDSTADNASTKGTCLAMQLHDSDSLPDADALLLSDTVANDDDTAAYLTPVALATSGLYVTGGVAASGGSGVVGDDLMHVIPSTDLCGHVSPLMACADPHAPDDSVDDFPYLLPPAPLPRALPGPAFGLQRHSSFLEPPPVANKPFVPGGFPADRPPCGNGDSHLPPAARQPPWPPALHCGVGDLAEVLPAVDHLLKSDAKMLNLLQSTLQWPQLATIHSLPNEHTINANQSSAQS